MSIGAAVVIAMLAELGLHYFPWRMMLKGKELPRVVAYALGVIGMMVPFTAWLWDRGEMDVIQSLWLVIVASGLTVLALYGLDRYLELEMRDIEASEREQVMVKQVRERHAKR